MKTKEELNALKEEVETLNKKLAELNEEELEQVAGGISPIPLDPGDIPKFPWITDHSQSYCEVMHYINIGDSGAAERRISVYGRSFKPGEWDEVIEAFEKKFGRYPRLPLFR